MKWFKKNSCSKNNETDKSGTNQHQEADEPPKYPSLDLAFTLTKELITAQIQNVDALDNKAYIALGSATGLLSAALIFQPSLFTVHTGSSCSILIPSLLYTLPLLLRRAIPLLILLITYLVAVISFVTAYKIRNFEQVPKPGHFYYNLHLTEQEAKALMFGAMVDAYDNNKKETDKKSRWINIALLAVVVETFILGLLLLYHVMC